MQINLKIIENNCEASRVYNEGRLVDENHSHLDSTIRLTLGVIRSH